jgi:rhamnosyltransferase subunit B
MARILLGWELGNGIGYARRLAAIADRLAEIGHQPVLALRDIGALPNSAHPVVQAPMVVGRLRPGTRSFVPAGFADLIACNGFGSVDHLWSILRSWQELMNLCRPDLVVAEYAPCLVLAAWRRIPTVLIGTPYLMPPAEGPTFPERVGVRPYADQAAVLAVMREVQSASGGATPERVTQPFAEAARVPYGLPELDPWSGQRRERLCGSWDPIPPTPPPEHPRLFAYLSPQAPGFAGAANAVAAARIPGEAYIPGCPPQLESALLANGIVLRREPPPLTEAVGRATFVFHHGGNDTAQTALVLGRPQVVMPRYLDQRLTGEALAALGIGVLLGRNQPAAAIAAILVRAAGDRGLAERARLRSVLIRRRGIGDALAATLEATGTLLRPK